MIENSNTYLALLELGHTLEDEEISFGATQKDDKSLINIAIKSIQEKICQNREKLLTKVNSAGTSAIAIIFDALISLAGQIPLAIATLAKEIARIGISSFCKNPEALLNSEK